LTVTSSVAKKEKKDNREKREAVSFGNTQEVKIKHEK
jgi:hypothetical protein